MAVSIKFEDGWGAKSLQLNTRESEGQRFSVRIEKTDIGEHVPSDDCDGCTQQLIGGKQRRNTDEYRMRSEQKLSIVLFYR